MRKTLLICSCLLLIFFFFGDVSAYAQEEFKALAPIPGLTAPNPGEGSVIDSDNLANFFNNLYKYLIGIAAILAIIQIIRGGLEISTQDSISKQSAGREHIRDAIFGLVLVLAPVLVFSIINPTILNLSLNLPGLETAGSPNNGGEGAEEGDVDENGCTTTHAGSYLTQASCPDQAAANSYQCASGMDLVVRCVENNDGSCVTGDVSAYCQKTVDNLVYYVTSYINASYLTGFLTGTGAPIPRDTSAANTFISGCTGDGGYVWARANLTSLANARGGNCSSFGADTGVNTLPSPAPGQYACYTESYTCQTDAPATDRTLAVGAVCEENRQCQTNFCDLQVSPHRCTNVPDADNNQCQPGPNPPVGMACPTGQECAIKTGTNQYVCQNVCIQEGYTPPEEYSVACPTTGPQAAAFQYFCPTGAPLWNECKMLPPESSVPMAVCFNMSEQTGCLTAEPKRVSDILRDAP